MSPLSFCRVAVWTPILVPALLVGCRELIGRDVELGRLGGQIGFLAGTLVYGGIPYGALALWATWRIGRLSEPEIRRLMFKAPWLMVVSFTAFWFLAGLRVGHPEFGILGPLFAVLIVPVAYGYVGLVLIVREILGQRVR